MELINLLFVLLNGWLVIHSFGEDEPWLLSLNVFAFTLNLIPVVTKLMS